MASSVSSSLHFGWFQELYALVQDPQHIEWNAVGQHVQTFPTWWWSLAVHTWENNPGHVLLEAFCIAFIIVLLFLKPSSSRKEEKLTAKEEEELIREWKPEPLVPVLSAELQEAANRPVRIAEGTTDAYVRVNGRECLNLASYNFLGIASMQEIKDVCEATILKYGVGSCGPRGFYGTIDVHLELEKKIAQFFGTEEAILYSDGLACVSSVIPAFAKAGDLIICDEGVNFHIQQGLLLSRSQIKYFKHNDMADLESVLKSVIAEDKKTGRRLNRRFLVAEGIYHNYGDLCKLSQIVELKNKYKFRLILDDSMGFGVLGATGRGTPEEFGVPMSEIEIYCAALDATISTCGGFCTGTHEVCNHQRLSGAGYCFSASSPPYSSVAAMKALEILQEHPESLAKLKQNSITLHDLLRDIDSLSFQGSDISPVVHLYLSKSKTAEAELRALQYVSDELDRHDIIACVSQYIPQEVKRPRPSLRVLITCNHSEADLRKFVTKLKSIVHQPKFMELAK